MRDRDFKTAKKFNIVDKIRKLEKELLTVNGVIDIDFDLDGFYDNMCQVIFLTKYDISINLDNYFEVKRQLIKEVIEVAAKNGLKRTEDRIEDYGEHFYFVFKHDNTWKTVN